jgi:aryl-alcohol dehydrogenase-like predicted oxidoreductase
MLSGYATTAGTDAYRQRFATSVHPLHFRLSANLRLSSIGLDTAINYRHQRSERVIGQVLSTLARENVLHREEIVVATKGGYLAFDGTVPPDPRAYVQETFIKTGLASADDIVEWNCIAPRYIDNQVDRSLHNLNLNCLDIY